MSDLFSTHNSNSESFYHKAIKRLLYKSISENSKNVKEKSLEKYINNRRADVYFRLNSGKQIVIEVQNSKISVKELIQRTEHYNESGIYVLWILYGNGACTASPKFPQDKKNIKISQLENFLHWMYSGRVYYVNFNFYENKTTISIPFALHFSLSSKKKKQKLFRTKFESYYIKNVNFACIPSWNLVV
ncbi:MAG: competence protein CoiA family protein [Promethearchaeota archaeon]